MRHISEILGDCKDVYLEGGNKKLTYHVNHDISYVEYKELYNITGVENNGYTYHQMMKKLKSMLDTIIETDKNITTHEL